MLIATVVGQPVVPRLFRHVHIVVAEAIALVVFGVCAIPLVATHNLALVLALSAGRGCGLAVLTVGGTLLAAMLVPHSRLGESTSLVGVCGAAGNLIALPVGLLVTQHGLFWIACLMAALPVLMSPLALSIRHAPSRLRLPERTRLLEQLGHLRSLIPVTLMLFVATMTAGEITIFLPLTITAGPTAAVALLAVGVTSTLTRWIVGSLIDRRNATNLTWASIGVTIVGAVTAAGVLIVDPSPSLLIVATIAIFGCGLGAIQTVSSVLSFRRAPDHAALNASALWNCAYDAGSIVGVSVFGIVANVGLGLGGALLISAGLLALTQAINIANRSEIREPTTRGEK